jgi:hypothetical protein
LLSLYRQQLTAENMPDQIKEQVKSEIERQLAKGTLVND